jgi:raffinose/stachyose/melibiose transport system permease protein
MSKKTVKRIIHGSIAFILAIIFLSPFYVLVTNSFKTPKGIFKDIFGLPGEYFTLQNYKNAFIELDFVKTFFNSSLITIVGTALIITTSCMAAWVLARNKTKTSKRIYLLFSIYILVPFQCVMLPLVKFMGQLNMMNVWGLIIMYIGFGSSMAVMFFHGYIKSIPISLEESAVIDGCKPWKIFFKIIFPLCRPMTFTIAILDFMWLWNDFLLPSLVINTPNTLTIPLKMYYFFGKYTKKWELATAALVITIIPTMVFFAFSQKHIIKGITSGAIK